MLRCNVLEARWATLRSKLAVSAGLMKLLDNYERSTGVAESVTPDEVTENNLFLDAVLETEVMKVCVCVLGFSPLQLQEH